MTTDERNFSPVVFVLIAVFLWSTGGLFIKLTTLDAYQVTFFRSLFAAVTVLLLTRKDGLRIDAFGILTTIIYALLLFLFVWATKKTTAANAIFLQYTAPIYILVFAPFVIGEKFHLRDLITVVVVLAGIEGHNEREVARLLNLPQGTVKSRLFLGRQRLKEALRWMIE